MHHAMTLEECRRLPLVWRPTNQAEYPYESMVSGGVARLRLNDFPAEPLYTLIVDGKEIGRFDDWPGPWRRPD